MDLSTDLTCPECGEQLEDADFCGSCGAQLLSPAEAVQNGQDGDVVSVPWPGPVADSAVEATEQARLPVAAEDEGSASSDTSTAPPDTEHTTENDKNDHPMASTPVENESPSIVMSDPVLDPILGESSLPDVAADLTDAESGEDANAETEVGAPTLPPEELPTSDDGPAELNDASRSSTTLETEPATELPNTEESVTAAADAAGPSSDEVDTAASDTDVIVSATTTIAETAALTEQATDAAPESEPTTTTEVELSNEDITSEQDPPAQIPSDATVSSSSQSSMKHPMFWGSARSLFGIFLVNTFLTILTLGVYSFWGRTRVRQFLFSQTSFAKSRFSYHGTGKELLLGWLKAVLVFGVPYTVLTSVSRWVEGVPPWISVSIAVLLLVVFVPVAVVGAHRYRLSRTSLRNIRFSFRGSVSEYAKLWIKGAVLSVLTLGVYLPFFDNARRAYLVTHSQFGNRTFRYDGDGKDLLTVYAMASGLFLITLGLAAGVVFATMVYGMHIPPSDMHAIMAGGWLGLLVPMSAVVPWFYLQAARQRFFWDHTLMGEARFHSTMMTWPLCELRLTHFLLLVVTLGLAWPLVQIRNLEFLYYHTGLEGALNMQKVTQDALEGSPTGEELAGFFDTGFDLG